MAITESIAVEPIYFCKPFENPHGFLSQWYEIPFKVDGVTYASAEMWMMVQKAKLFGDEEIANQMMQTTSPADHQALGRKTRGFNRPEWDQHKSRIVEEGNYHKFSKAMDDGSLLQKLLATGERELVEVSPKDRIWGVGFCAEHAGENRESWGENRLGKAIMNVRQRLRQEGI